MVFTVGQGERTSVWIAPAYDPENGFVQYAYVIPGVMTTLISIKLTPQDHLTHVAVRYERTALSTAAKELVLAKADEDSQSGPEWQNQINGYLGSLSK